MASKEKHWVPYDQFVLSDTCPGDEYVCLDSDETLSLRRDAEGVIWLVVEVPGKSAMLRIDARGPIVADVVEAYLAAQEKATPDPSPSPEGGEGGER